MWIFLGIVAFLALLITAILMLPVYIILKTDTNGELILRYKFLNKIYGENPDPNNRVVKTLKDASGFSRLEKDKLKNSVKSGSLSNTVSESLTLIISLLKRLLALLKYCKIKILKIKIVCAEGDAAQTAINYGRCYAVLAPFMSFLHSTMKISKKGEDISINCDYLKEKGVFEFETLLQVRIYRVIVALFLAAFDEAKRISKQETDNSKRKN